jgi:hypothetical protein
MRLASEGAEAYEGDDDLERQGAPFRVYPGKQVVM